MRRLLSLAAVIPLLLAALTACGDEEVASPFAGCDSLTSPPAAGSAQPGPAAASAQPGSAPASASSGPASSASAPAAGSAAAVLPDLRLDCFTGDDTVALRDLRGPAVINLWSSWCPPCREELPIIQQLADQTKGRLLVLGVDTGDTRANGAGFASERAVTMPTLFDPDKKLLNAVGRITLPVTVFLDAAGRSYVHPLPMDAAGLAEQVRKNTGVTVTP